MVCINWGECEAMHKLIRKLSWLFANYLKHKNNWRNSNKSLYRTKKQPIGFRILKTKSSYSAGFSPGPKKLGKLWVKEMTKRQQIRTKLAKLKTRLVSQKNSATPKATSALSGRILRVLFKIVQPCGCVMFFIWTRWQALKWQAKPKSKLKLNDIDGK